MKKYEEAQKVIDSLNEKQIKIAGKYKHFLNNIKNSKMEHSVKAADVLIKEMNSQKGFSRHNGDDYFVHPIEVAMEALHLGLYDDEIIASCLLHDVMEDIDFITFEYIKEEFSHEIAIIVDNVSKRDNEPFEQYLDRISSHPKSAIVKTLDRMNNVSTMGDSKLEHREKQLKETREIYLPLFKTFRRLYWVYSDTFEYARMTINKFLIEIERSIKLEQELIEIKEKDISDKVNNNELPF